MRLLLLPFLLSASLLAATSSSDRARLDRVEYTLKLQDETNDYMLNLYNDSVATNTSQNDTILYLLETNSRLQARIIKLEQQTKALEKRVRP